MQANLEDYYILSSIFCGNNWIITFQSDFDMHDRRVLELIEVAGFINRHNDNKPKTLRIADGGTYPYDLSLRLERPEIADYPETLFFTDDKCTNISFRACARIIIFREWTEKDVGSK